jgi:hypothetical protein
MKIMVKGTVVETITIDPGDAPTRIREKLAAVGARYVDARFEYGAEVDDFQGQDGGWVGPEAMKKVLDGLNERWVMAANNMGTAETDAAAGEWATRMREVEYAQQTLRRLMGEE